MGSVKMREKLDVFHTSHLYQCLYSKCLLTAFSLYLYRHGVRSIIYFVTWFLQDVHQLRWRVTDVTAPVLWSRLHNFG
jgi:hypothetical protein